VKTKILGREEKTEGRKGKNLREGRKKKKGLFVVGKTRERFRMKGTGPIHMENKCKGAENKAEMCFGAPPI
jgi:hypothetical protein